MTKEEALYQFYSSFGIPAYPVNNVPKDVAFPWLTYQPIMGLAWEGSYSVTVTIWYHTASEAVPNAKAQEIADAIGLGGKSIAYDGGMIWIRRGSPFATPIDDQADAQVKGRVMNLTIEIL